MSRRQNHPGDQCLRVRRRRDYQILMYCGVLIGTM